MVFNDIYVYTRQYLINLFNYLINVRQIMFFFMFVGLARGGEVG